ncbi:unnamed protein product [Lampetra fluviatilis]
MGAHLELTGHDGVASERAGYRASFPAASRTPPTRIACGGPHQDPLPPTPWSPDAATAMLPRGATGGAQGGRCPVPTAVFPRGGERERGRQGNETLRQGSERGGGWNEERQGAAKNICSGPPESLEHREREPELGSRNPRHARRSRSHLEKLENRPQ